MKNEHFPITHSTNFSVRLSFIHTLGDETATQRDPNSLFNASLSRYAPPNAIKGLIFIPFAFALRQTNVFTFTCSVFFNDTSFFSVASTVVEAVISTYTSVSSMTIIDAGLYLNFSDNLRACNK